MAAEGKLDFKSAKIALKVTKSALTKASSEFENSCKDIQKNAEAVHIKRVRLAASVMESLDNVNQKVKKMIDAKDMLIEIIIGMEENALSKSKEDHITELDNEHEKYMLNIKEIKTGSEEMVAMTETLLCPVESTQPATAVAPGSAVVSGEMFKPQSNLKPSFLDKQANHLEVRNFCQSVEVYIVTGFKDKPPHKCGHT